jgi:hypothetical protein
MTCQGGLKQFRWQPPNVKRKQEQCGAADSSTHLLHPNLRVWLDLYWTRPGWERRIVVLVEHELELEPDYPFRLRTVVGRIGRRVTLQAQPVVRVGGDVLHEEVVVPFVGALVHCVLLLVHEDDEDRLRGVVVNHLEAPLQEPWPTRVVRPRSNHKAFFFIGLDAHHKRRPET